MSLYACAQPIMDCGENLADRPRCIYYVILPVCIRLQFWAGLPGFGAQSSCLIKKKFGMIKLCSVKTCHMPGVRHCEGARYVYPAGSWMADALSRHIILYVSRGAVKASHTVYVCQCVVKGGGYIYHVCQVVLPQLLAGVFFKSIISGSIKMLKM